MTGLLLLFTAAGVPLLIGVLQRRFRRLRSIAGGLFLSYLTIGLMLGGGEFYLRCCYTAFDNLPLLTNQNWFNQYYKVNSLGFRDREWTPADWEDKQTVLVVGDSFAAGLGIEDPKDRFSDVLAAHLGDDYAVINIAVWGTMTPQQLDILQKHPVQKPDVVIWQYFLNDIEYSVLKLGIMPQTPTTPSFVNESYLADFLFWRLMPTMRVVGVDGTEYPDWWTWTYSAYDNYAVWQTHREEIQAVVDYVESIDARLIVVIFPNLTQVMESIPYVDRVARVFEERGQTEILKLFDEAAAWKTQELIASPRDTHPSEAFSRRVGDLLYEQFFQDEMTYGP